jgi:antitoxin component of RelBE/YafQ-DinJ toxin-antitoxin module
MVLDAEKQDLGVFSQKEPLQFGFIKQKASDLGMTTQEFIKAFADKVMKQAEQPQPTLSNDEIKEIKEQIKEQSKAIALFMQNMANKQVSPPQPPLQGLREIVSAMKELRAYDNEVIAGYKATVQETVSEMPDLSSLTDEEGGSELGDLMKLMTIIAPNGAAGNSSQGIKVSTPAVTPSNEVHAVNYNEIAAKVPQNIKDGIKDGSITYESFFALARQHTAQGTEQDIKKVYDIVKG